MFFKSFITQAGSLVLAGYGPCSFLSVNLRVRTVGQYPAMLNGPRLRVFNNLMGITIAGITTKRNFLNDLTASLRKEFESFIYFFICLFLEN